jgi:hypothetical protein
VVLDVGATETEPEVPPAEKPLPEHELAFVELHVIVANCPLVIEAGLTESELVGTGVGVGTGVVVGADVGVGEPDVSSSRSMFATTGG